MLAKTPAAEAAPPPAEIKHRTITLTNRAPIRIVEDEWPVIAQGRCADDNPDAPWGWKIEIHVRREMRFGRYLIHANFHHWDESEEYSERVRVGRLLTENEACLNLYKYILAVGEELRQRLGPRYLYSSDKRQEHEKVLYEKMSRNIRHALDDCFANLPPSDG